METVLGLCRVIVDNAPELVGFILPPFVLILNRDVKNDTERFWVSVLVCIFVTGLLHWRKLTGNSPEEIFVWFGIIFTESQVTYNLYFKNSYLREVIDRKIQPKEDLVRSNSTETVE